MEIILEFIMEFILGVPFEVAQDEKAPKGMRIGALVFLSFIYFAFSACLIGCCVHYESLIWEIITIPVVIFLTVVFGKMWYRVLKIKKQGERD